MEYKGVRYTIRTGIERERWSVASAKYPILAVAVGAERKALNSQRSAKTVLSGKSSELQRKASRERAILARRHMTRVQRSDTQKAKKARFLEARLDGGERAAETPWRRE
jgi:hypothetical protein